jgi:hypothetical protein
VDVEEAALGVNAETAASAARDVLLAGAEGGVDVGGGEARVVVDGVARDAVGLGALANHVEVLVDLETRTRPVVTRALRRRGLS